MWVKVIAKFIPIFIGIFRPIVIYTSVAIFMGLFILKEKGYESIHHIQSIHTEKRDMNHRMKIGYDS